MLCLTVESFENYKFYIIIFYYSILLYNYLNIEILQDYLQQHFPSFIKGPDCHFWVAQYFSFYQRGFCQARTIFKNITAMNTQPAPWHQNSKGRSWVIFTNKILIQCMLVFQQFSHISSELKPQKRHNTENEPEIRLQLPGANKIILDSLFPVIEYQMWIECCWDTGEPFPKNLYPWTNK